MRGKLEERAHGFFKSGAPAKLADRLALLDVAELIPDIALVATQGRSDLVAAAKAFFAVTESFRIGRIEDAVRSIAVTDYYDGLALSRAADVIGTRPARHRGVGAVGRRQVGRSGRRLARGRRRAHPAHPRAAAGADRRRRHHACRGCRVASGLMSDLGSARWTSRRG